MNRCTTLKLLAGAAVTPALARPAFAAPQTVRIVNIGTDYWAGPLYVGEQSGLFEKRDLKPDVTSVKGGALALQTLVAKEADVAMLSYEHVVAATTKGQPIVAIYRLVKRPINNIVAANAVLANARGADVMTRVRKLKGLRIGLPSAGGSGETLLHVLGSRAGLKVGDYTSVYLGSEPGSYLAAFQHSQIDAALPVEPAGVLLEQSHIGGTLVNLMGGDVKEFDDLLYMCLAVHADAMRDNQPLLRRTVSAFKDAMNVLMRNPQTGEQMMGKQFGALSPQTNAAMYAAMRKVWTPDGRMSQPEAERVVTYLSQNGGITVPAGYNVQATFSNALL